MFKGIGSVVDEMRRGEYGDPLYSDQVHKENVMKHW